MNDLLYEVIVTDKHGKVIDREAGVSRSWLVAYNKGLMGTFSGSAQTIVDIGGVGRTQDITYSFFSSQGLANYDNYGAVIGTGNTAVTVSDYKLDAQIGHGTGAGQMLYLAGSVSSPTVSASASSFTNTRQFINVSGDSITVREIGIYGYIKSPYYGCYVRDVLGAAKVIPDGGAMTVIYTISHEE